MTAITRRGAMLASAAAVAVAGAPVAIQAPDQDPEIDALCNEWQQHNARLDENDIETQERDTIYDRLADIEAQIIETPVRMLGGLLKKANMAWQIAALDYGFDKANPDLSEVPRLDDCVAIWFMLQDVERLTGEARL